MANYSAVKGVKDILPGESEKWQELEARARDYFGRFGFKEIRIPIFEKTQVFSRGLGDTTDIVEKEMYTFNDRGGESITLRPEGTASVVRAYIEHQLYHPPGITKLFYIGPMFRCERPQAGRYRQFYQLGAELFGTDSPEADAETLTMLMEYLGSFRPKNLTLNINSLGCSECRPSYRESLITFTKGHLEQFCPNCTNRYERNPLRIFDCKSKGCIEATKEAPLITDHLCNNCLAHHASVKKNLSIMDVNYLESPRLVRGLDYYTKTAFEITAEGLGAQNAIAGGGRYDGLVEDLGGPATPAFGFAIGLERMLALLDETTFQAASKKIFIASLGERAVNESLKMASTLRKNGFTVERNFDSGGLKSQLKRANRACADYTLMIGDNELDRGHVILRDMKSGDQFEVKSEELEDKLKSLSA